MRMLVRIILDGKLIATEVTAGGSDDEVWVAKRLALARALQNGTLGLGDALRASFEVVAAVMPADRPDAR